MYIEGDVPQHAYFCVFVTKSHHFSPVTFATTFHQYVPHRSVSITICRTTKIPRWTVTSVTGHRVGRVVRCVAPCGAVVGRGSRSLRPWKGGRGAHDAPQVRTIDLPLPLVHEIILVVLGGPAECLNKHFKMFGFKVLTAMCHSCPEKVDNRQTFLEGIEGRPNQNMSRCKVPSVPQNMLGIERARESKHVCIFVGLICFRLCPRRDRTICQPPKTFDP